MIEAMSRSMHQLCPGPGNVRTHCTCDIIEGRFSLLYQNADFYVQSQVHVQYIEYKGYVTGLPVTS